MSSADGERHRTAFVYSPLEERATIEAYLPDNYRIMGTFTEDDGLGKRTGFVIRGHDEAGWTLDEYVLPRLASGMHFGQEV
jgi:hypothetical protein